MGTVFAETLRRLRRERGLSQEQLAQLMFVNHSTISRWERGSRLPDTVMLLRLAERLGVDPSSLFVSAAQSEGSPNVIVVDDNRPQLADAVSVIGEVLPNATVTGFAWPLEALRYARASRVALAVLDIELGVASGLDLCHTLHEIWPRVNVVFLTAYPEYSLDAWGTEASGFILKPLTVEGVREQLVRLRFPLVSAGEGE